MKYIFSKFVVIISSFWRFWVVIIRGVVIDGLVKVIILSIFWIVIISFWEFVDFIVFCLVIVFGLRIVNR